MNSSIQQNLLVINFHYDVDIQLIKKLAENNSNIVLNGNCSAEKITEIVKFLSTLGIQIFHHGSDILDLKEVDLLLEDSERLLGQIDAVVIFIRDKNYKSILPFIDKCLSIMSNKGTGPVINLTSDQLVVSESDDKMKKPDSKANVENMIESLIRGDKLPPLIVRRYNNYYQILDGHHRFYAYRLLKINNISVQVAPNDIHGKLINIIFPDSDVDKTELDKYCFEKLKEFTDIKYISNFYNSNKISDLTSIILE